MKRSERSVPEWHNRELGVPQQLAPRRALRNYAALSDVGTLLCPSKRIENYEPQPRRSLSQAHPNVEPNQVEVLPLDNHLICGSWRDVNRFPPNPEPKELSNRETQLRFQEKVGPLPGYTASTNGEMRRKRTQGSEDIRHSTRHF